LLKFSETAGYVKLTQRADYNVVGPGIAACGQQQGRDLQMSEPKAKRPATSSVAARVMARTMQRVAQDRDDPELMADAIEYENRALAAIKLHSPVLGPKPEKPKPAAIKVGNPELGPKPERKPAAYQLRFPGF
jgi:hypothetical protein